MFVVRIGTRQLKGVAY
ncbi:hypothetical protein MTR67_047797 [Solanum verrucosum]|uniref:Uncharacterized protein n=1 Tax=Solanum verrucosum TaxID=315347 RepID=A0AAF0UX95_SOLVR|nr:hypothetical protein MTR67_047797 [Solanum verrucosum]